MITNTRGNPVKYLVLRSRDGEITVSVLNFPVTCSPLLASVDILDYPHIRKSDLADYVEEQEPDRDTINVLVGSDHYWNFVTGETTRGDIYIHHRSSLFTLTQTITLITIGTLSPEKQPVRTFTFIIEAHYLP